MRKKNQMKDFERICDGLEYRKKCKCPCYTEKNEYLCAKEAVERFVGNDKNKLLKLKAEASTSDWWSYMASMVAIVAMVVSAFSLIFTVAEATFLDGIVERGVYGSIMLLAFAWFGALVMKRIKKYQGVAEWRGYVTLAIDELYETMGRVDADGK